MMRSRRKVTTNIFLENAITEHNFSNKSYEHRDFKIEMNFYEQIIKIVMSSQIIQIIIIEETLIDKV